MYWKHNDDLFNLTPILDIFSEKFKISNFNFDGMLVSFRGKARDCILNLKTIWNYDFQFWSHKEYHAILK